MNPEVHALFVALSEKRMALFAYAQKLLKAKTPANAMEIDIELGRVDLEVQLINATLSDLAHNIPMAFPSEDQVRRLRELVAELQRRINASAAVGQLIAAGDAVIQAFPGIGN